MHLRVILQVRFLFRGLPQVCLPHHPFVAMRYFAELSYRGTAYGGWQRQPNSLAVQQVVEEALFLLLREQVEVVGCGRTDAGVHASYFVMHLDVHAPLPTWLPYRLNKVLPADIAVRRFTQVAPETHARFDATRRAYAYYLSWEKNPFRTETSWTFPPAVDFSHQVLNEAAGLLLHYKAFFPFCKSGSDAHTMNCQLYRSEWKHFPEQGLWVFHIAANRFLRGMVRLVVGMCVNVARNKLTLEQVKLALDRQERLAGSESAPPEGLFLTEVCYPDHLFQGHQPDFCGSPFPSS